MQNDDKKWSILAIFKGPKAWKIHKVGSWPPSQLLVPQLSGLDLCDIKSRLKNRLINIEAKVTKFEKMIIFGTFAKGLEN